MSAAAWDRHYVPRGLLADPLQDKVQHSAQSRKTAALSPRFLWAGGQAGLRGGLGDTSHHRCKAGRRMGGQVWVPGD